MSMIYTSPDLVLVNHVRNLLESAGIEVTVTRRYLAGALGELPFTETWPQLWLRDPRDERRARDIIAASQRASTAVWRCTCGELLEEQFTACWKCGRQRGEGAI